MFGTSGVRGPFGTDVTADLALSIGRAVASDCADRSDGVDRDDAADSGDGADSADGTDRRGGTVRIVIGRDPRTTGELLADAAGAGARECGADVIDVGVAATPTIARSVGWQDADAGIAITASHNPPADNGLKLWQPSGQAFDEERRERIAEHVDADDPAIADWDAVGSRSTWDGAEERHVAAIANAVGGGDAAAIPDLEVVVDVGNGAGGITVGALRELGCSVSGLNERPDGRFPSRQSEPTAESLSTLRSVVAATDADLGIAHDGDADRMVTVDETGAVVGGDALLALFAVDAVRDAVGDAAPDANGGPGGDASDDPIRVAAPVNTSLAVDDALAECGATVARTRVGDVFVAERASEPDVVFGGEPSGAWIWPDATRCPDGPLAACRLAAMVAGNGPLSELVGALPEYPIRRDSREVAEKRAAMEQIQKTATREYDDVETVDGVRVTTDAGWFLVRASGTQPLIRVTAEARDAERADELLAAGHALLDDVDDPSIEG